MTKEAICQTIAKTWLETSPEMYQQCPPSHFVCGYCNATRLLAALEREGYIIFKAERRERAHC